MNATGDFPTILDSALTYAARGDARAAPVGDKSQPSADLDAVSQPAAISPTAFVLRPAHEIPPRQWLYGKHLIRGFLSLTVAPGGLGKSSMVLVDALAMATGKALLGSKPPEPLRVWVWNGEDPREEIERRITAACVHYGITADDLGDRLLVDSGRDLPIILATTGNDGVRIARPVADQLKAAIRAAKIDVLIIDPFVTTHEVNENDNTAINAVAAEWRRIADETGCAIELVHHTSKAGAANGNNFGIYASRGGRRAHRCGKGGAVSGADDPTGSRSFRHRGNRGARHLPRLHRWQGQPRAPGARIVAEDDQHKPGQRFDPLARGRSRRRLYDMDATGCFRGRHGARPVGGSTRHCSADRAPQQEREGADLGGIYCRRRPRAGSRRPHEQDCRQNAKPKCGASQSSGDARGLDQVAHSGD